MALRNLQLVNGGGILALLTFLGNTNVTFGFNGIWWAFFWFGGGLTTSLSAYFGAFFSQFYFLQVTFKQAWNAQRRARGARETYDFKSDFDVGNKFLFGSVVAALASLFCFVVGAFVALAALQ
ncbi:MAG: hypothetical protein WBA68_10860 [Alteraurantiacibacter sp.]